MPPRDHGGRYAKEPRPANRKQSDRLLKKEERRLKNGAVGRVCSGRGEDAEGKPA